MQPFLAAHAAAAQFDEIGLLSVSSGRNRRLMESTAFGGRPDEVVGMTASPLKADEIGRGLNVRC